MNLGKKNVYCPTGKAHDDVLTVVNQQKYLGDVLTNNSLQKANIESRRIRDYTIVADILPIISEILLGKHKMQTGLLL